MLTFPIGITDCTSNVHVEGKDGRQHGVYGVPRVGRAVLGRWAWLWMAGDFQAWWVAWVRRDPESAIASYNRGKDVDVGKVLETLKASRELKDGGEN